MTENTVYGASAPRNAYPQYYAAYRPAVPTKYYRIYVPMARTKPPVKPKTPFLALLMTFLIVAVAMGASLGYVLNEQNTQAVISDNSSNNSPKGDSGPAGNGYVSPVPDNPSVPDIPNPEVVVSGTLFNDKSGANYATSCVAPGQAVIASQSMDQKPLIVNVDSSEPVVESGTYTLIETEDGSYDIVSAAPLPLVTMDDATLANDGRSYDNKNVQMSFNSVGVVIDNHTFGVSTDLNGVTVAYVVFDKKPNFFTKVTVTGVMVSEQFFDTLLLDAGKIFNIDFRDDISTMLDLLPRFDANSLSSYASFLLVESISYETPLNSVSADVLDVITPEDVADIITGSGLIEQGSQGAEFLYNYAKMLNQQVIIMTDKDNKLTDYSMWFVISTKDLTKNKLTGIVTLSVYESDFTVITEALGLSFNDYKFSAGLKIRVGVTDNYDPVFKSSYKNVEIRDLWDSYSNPRGTAVSLNTFAGVVKLSDILYVGKYCGIPTEKLSFITNFRNPAVALLVDRNIGGSNGYFSQENIAFAIFTDYNGSNLAVLHISGVKYDLNYFFGIESSTQIPIIIADSWGDGQLNDVSASVEDLYNSPEEYDVMSNGIGKTVAVGGTIVGSTLKNNIVLEKVLGFVGISIDDIPFDIGFYDLSQPTGDLLGIVEWHMLVLKISIGTVRGDVYNGEMKTVHGWFFKAGDGDGGGNVLINGALQAANFWGYNPIVNGDKTVNGFMLAYSIN